MSDNPLKVYKDFVRNNLPTGITYNEDVARFQINNHSFFQFKPAEWYRRYIINFGYSPAFSPESLFAGGENGAWFEPSDLTTLFQDTAATVPVTAPGQAVARINDKSGNARNATQATTSARPTYFATPDRIALDQVDDNMGVNFGAAFTGTVLQGTPNGVLHYDVNVPSGSWGLSVDPRYIPDGGNITGMIARDGTLTDGEVNDVKAYLRDNGAGGDFAGVTSMARWFRGRTDVAAIYANDWDTSSVIDFSLFAFGCSNLTTLDVSNWNTSLVTGFNAFAFSCKFTTLDVSNWDTSSANNFNSFLNSCSNLTTLDVSNWNTSSVTNFSNFAINCNSLITVTVNGGTGNPFADSPCTNYTNAFFNTNLTQQSIDDILVAINAAGTSNGTFNQSGGSAPSTTGQAAITALRSRGWTVTVTGGF